MSSYSFTPELEYPSQELVHIGGGTPEPTDVGPRGLPILRYPQRVSTPVLQEMVTPLAVELALKGARIQEWAMQAAVHAAMVAQAVELLEGATVSRCIQAFKAEPPTIPSYAAEELHTLEEAPLPIPPRTESPEPLIDETSSTLPPYSPSYHVYTPPTTPSNDPRPPAQPYEHPGHDWIPNGEVGNPLHDVQIPVGTGERIIAPFVRYDYDTDSPKLLATLGRGCPVHSTFLYARPVVERVSLFTRKERYLFQPDETFTPITQAAIDRLGDATLKAETIRYQRFTRRTRRIARQLGEMREEYEQARELAHESQQ